MAHDSSDSILELGVTRIIYAQDFSLLLGETGHVSKPKVDSHVAFVVVRIGPYLRMHVKQNT